MEKRWLLWPLSHRNARTALSQTIMSEASLFSDVSADSDKNMDTNKGILS